MSYKPIQQWLKLNGYIEEKMFEQFGKAYSVPTQKGESIGIRSEVRKSMRGVDYMATIYGKEAQKFIVKNIDKIMTGEVCDE